ASCEVVSIPSARVTHEGLRRGRGQGHPTKGITQFPANLFLRLLGYYLAEGWCQKAKRPRYEVNLAQAPGGSQHRIVDTIRALGLRPRVSGHHVTFASKELWHFLQDCGSGADAKYIPTWIKSLDAPLLEVLLESLIDGDGTRNSDGSPKKFYSTSKTLA